MLKFRLIYFFVLLSLVANSQKPVIDSFRRGDIKITIDRPSPLVTKNKTIIIFFALPNGNTTEQTMGKKMQPGDDWHFDIQHIRAQTAFIRNELQETNVVVIYLENDYKSWPGWKQRHPGFKKEIPVLIDSLIALIPSKDAHVYLNGHSGGGSFIFGYLAGVEKIPQKIKRISFLDSNYGYDSSYYPKFKTWLKETDGAGLNVFAYNDSVALYNGKPFVSATGGTWWRSHHMLKHFREDFEFRQSSTDSLDIYKSKNEKIQFYFKLNFNRGIYHTQQVELNGFIHSVLCGTQRDSKKYIYYGPRAYGDWIE